jgi:riboflavin kinase/FMN adenylyltransferase
MIKITLNEGISDTRPSVATIGFFDGVHRGHRYLINSVVKEAEARGLQSTVVTFDRHPRQVLGSDFQPQLLSTNEEKQILLSKTGVERCVMLPFSKQMAQLSARDFMENILKERLGVQVLIIGYDNRFGHNRNEGFDDYVRYGKDLGMEVTQSDGFAHVKGYGDNQQEVNVSSTLVRSYIEKGNLEAANDCLGHPYFLTGKVVHGVKEGRKLGFPTANLDVSSSRQLIPPSGVYAVKVRIPGSMTDYHGMMNIGVRPTFDGAQQTLEVHIMQYTGNLYGEEIHVAFLHRIRGERKFASPEELAVQLNKDKKQIEDLFAI